MKYRISVLTVSVALALAACGGDADPTTAPAVAPTPTTSEASAPTTMTAAPTTAAPVFVASDYGVVGVGPQEHLNVRASAGVTSERIGQLEYDTRGVARIGPEQTVDGADWWQVTAGGVTGWVHSGFLDLLGLPVNATDAYLLDLGTPTVATASELVQALVASFETNSADAEGTLDVSIAGVLDGEPTIAVIDVVGFPDDSVGGEHLVITMEPDDSAGWVITSIMSSPRCRRGVTASGICT